MKFSELFKKYKLPLRFQNIILNQIDKILRMLNNTTISKNKLDLDEVVSKRIVFLDTFPGPRLVYPCDNKEVVLRDLRYNKIISYLDLKKYNESFDTICKKINN